MGIYILENAAALGELSSTYEVLYCTTSLSHNVQTYIIRNIVHPESFRSNAQNANTFACRNRHASIATMSLRAFICVRVRLRVLFAIDRVRARACVRVHVRI